jgi:hypothetical protein
MPNVSYIRTEIKRIRVQVSRQRKEILQLQRSGISTASAELLLVRMHAKMAADGRPIPGMAVEAIKGFLTIPD